jgi:hypothetical protein
MERTVKQYGDEKTGYVILAGDMAPEDARRVLDENIADGLYELMPVKRRVALLKRASESN